MDLILASGSPIRRQLLEHAGVQHRVIPPEINESIIKAALVEPASIAAGLADAKATAVSQQWPDNWVIGSDSVVTVGGRRFSKPANRDEAVEHLRYFSGKVMTLTSAVALARGGKQQWTVTDQAELKVRELSEQFVQAYLAADWPEVAYCAGVFRMEGPGVQLFESVKGDYFTILGMPLLPLLGALRERGLVAA